MSIYLKYSAIKTIKAFCDENDIDWREVIESICDEVDDFEVDDWRFINEDDIDEIMTEELESDLFLLGCFNASFLSEIIGWPEKLIEVAQKGEAFEELGEAIAATGLTGEIAEAYAAADGYGHHFSPYDGDEHELAFKIETSNGQLRDMYYAFRLN